MYICDAFSVQKRINTAGLGLLSLERPVCEAGLWLAAGNVTPGAFPTLKGGLAVPRLFLRAAWLVLNMYVLPFGESCTCYAERAGLTGPSTRRRWVSNGPPGAEALHTGCCASLLESVLCVMPCVRVRGEPLEACAWISSKSVRADQLHFSLAVGCSIVTPHHSLYLQPTSMDILGCFQFGAVSIFQYYK